MTCGLGYLSRFGVEGLAPIVVDAKSGRRGVSERMILAGKEGSAEDPER